MCEYRVTYTTEWNSAPVLVTGAVNSSRCCVSLLFCYLSHPPEMPAGFLETQVTSAVHGEKNNTSTYSNWLSLLPQSFIAPHQQGITPAKSFFPAAGLCCKKKKYKNSWRILDTFNMKTSLPSCLLPCSASFHLLSSFSSWVLVSSPFC